MIDNGAGLINVPLNKWYKWNELISEFYLTGKMDKLKDWTYETEFQGIEFSSDPRVPKPTNDPKIMNNLYPYFKRIITYYK